MNLRTTRLFSYELPLIDPVYVRGETITKREGFFVEFIGEEGVLGVGEVAPLPGLHIETSEQTKRQLISILNHSSVADIESQLPQCFESVQFGLDIAIAMLRYRGQKGGWAEGIFGKPQHDCVKINGYIDAAEVSPESKALSLVAQGFSSIKVKISGNDIAEDIKRVFAICEAVGKQARVRVDANRAWSLAEAVEFCRAHRRHQIEYLEEPLKDIRQLESLSGMIDIPLALDETVYLGQLDELNSWDGVGVLVLKPNRLGRVERSLGLMKRARARGKNCVISSSFDSGFGLSILALMAAATKGGQMAAGLATSSYFSHDVLQPPFRAVRGSIKPATCLRALELFVPSECKFCRVL